MFKKLFTISFLLVLCASVLFAQSERLVLKPGGKTWTKIDRNVGVRDALKAAKLTNSSGQVAKHSFPGRDLTAAGTIDTMSYADLFAGAQTNFVMDGHDVELMWFVAPADLTIKAAGFSASDIVSNVNGATVSVRLLKLNWTPEELTNVPAPLYMGYYPSEGDGMNNSDPFGEEATDDWIDESEGAYPVPPWQHDDYDLWSDGGYGWPVVAEEQRDEEGNPDIFSYQWVEMMKLGFEPTVLSGEVFAVVVKNDGVAWDDGNTPDRVGFWSNTSPGLPGWKYYEAGRMAADEPGWWAREYTWNFAVIVDLTGDRAPVVSGVTNLPTTLSTDAREVSATVTDDNPGGGPAGVASAEIMYSIDGGAFVSAAMSQSGDVFTGSIPGQVAGTDVAYYVTATDVGGLSASSITFGYKIFLAENPSLLVFNGLSGTSGYPQSYYFGAGYWPTGGPEDEPPYTFGAYAFLEWDHDVWNYGLLTEDLANEYTHIIDATTGGPSDINSDVIATWLAADGERNYMLWGDEWLGAQSGWTNKTYEAGTFQYDVLGITADYNDVNYDASGDQGLASVVMPVEGSLLGGPLFDLHAQVSSDSGWTAPIIYDPTLEIEVDNWLDGVDFLDDVEVDMQAIGMDGATYNIGGHRTLAAGNKIVFLAFDPLSLDSQGDDGTQYWWYGFLPEVPNSQALTWFGANIVGVKQIDSNIPMSYSISQNYPNPFNPTTNITFSIPEQGNVTLTVFNTLGQEIATLVNDVKSAGTYEVNFDASNLSSGVYLYTIQSGSFVSTMKMILLK